VGTQIGSTITKMVEVPFDNAIPYRFNVTFNFSSITLPSPVVYIISLPQLAGTDGQTLDADMTPIGFLNVNLSSEGFDVTAGSDVYPGNVFVSSDFTDTAGSNLALGACPNAWAGSLSSPMALPVMCAAGYGQNTPNGTNSQTGGLWLNNIPAVAFYAAGGLPPSDAAPPAS
jgi:hypothetical protein